MSDNRADAADDHGEDATRSVPRHLETNLGFRLGRTHRLLRGQWARQLNDLGLTPPQAATLRAVCEEPGTSLRELARHMHVDVMNVRRLLDRLESLGLVSSSPDPTHRQRRVLHPTPQGSTIAREVAARSAAGSEQLAERLGIADYVQLQELLARLDLVLRADAADAAEAADAAADSAGDADIDENVR